MATSSYIQIVNEIKTVGIKALKDNLSHYLREVKQGILILVTDRGKVIAELKQPELENTINKENSIIKNWIQQGWLIPATKKKQECVASGLKLKKGTALKILEKDRAE